MSLTLLIFLITLALSSVVGVVTVKKTARQRSWLDEIETQKSIEQSDQIKSVQGKANGSTPSVGA